MDVDDFLEAETNKLGGRAKIVGSGSDDSGKSKEDSLFGHLDVVREQLKDKNITSALKEFEFLKSRYADMTKKQLMENKYIFNELLKLNLDIINKIESLKGEVHKKISIIQKLLADARARLTAGELNTANKLYIELREIIKDIPSVFAEEKNAVNTQLTAFYVALSVQIQKNSHSAFAVKKNVIEEAIEKAYSYLQAGHKHIPMEIYENINKLFMQLPEGHIYEKALLYNDIIKLFRSSSLGQESSQFIESLISQHHSLIETEKSLPDK